MFCLNLRYSEYISEKLAYLPHMLGRINHVLDETIQDCYERAKVILEKMKS